MTVRQTPLGIKLGDGFVSKITFDADPDVSLFERSVTPLGMDGGDAVDTTTMWNATVRTKSSRGLVDTTNGKIQAGYDPRVLAQILNLINVETRITYLLPDGSRWILYGYLKSAIPNALEEGQFPMMDCEIVHTNVNPSNGAEVLPHYYALGSSEPV